MAGKISIAVRAHFGTVTICNPEKRNALTVAMWKELQAAFVSLGGDASLRCILIRGQGEEAFASGADISEFGELRGSLEQVAEYHESLVPSALDAIAQCDVPVVAAIKGACVGGGLEIASVCDLRISAESAHFGIPVGLLGFPAAYRELQHLLRLAGRAAIVELLLEGRIYRAAEAYSKGIVTRVMPDAELDDEVSKTMERIARGSPLVARTHKQQMRVLTDTGLPGLEQRMAIYEFANSEDYAIGRDAFLTKRKPEFVGR